MRFGDIVVAVAIAITCGSTATFAKPLRVATSGDYAPFSTGLAQRGREGQRWEPRGFDPAVARAYAADRGIEIVWVPFRWPTLLGSLADGDFDVAMSGITIRPERSLAGRFGIPVATSGAVVIVRPAALVDCAIDAACPLSALDRPDVEIAVNAGGHLEQVARATFPNARLRPIPDNDRVRQVLLAGEVHVVVTDTLEAPHWLGGSGLRALPPFTQDRKAYLFPAGRDERARDLDRWLLAREADGSLARLRDLHLGAGAGSPTATPLAALLAAIDERLALMPDVARIKRRTGSPIEVPEREARVLDAALASTRRAALALPGRTADRLGYDPDAMRALFRAQIEAAKEIQRRTAPAPDDATLPDLDATLRPALIRIGDRIAFLAVRLSPDPSRPSLRRLIEAALDAHALDPATLEALREALVRIETSNASATGGG